MKPLEDTTSHKQKCLMVTDKLNSKNKKYLRISRYIVNNAQVKFINTNHFVIFTYNTE